MAKPKKAKTSSDLERAFAFHWNLLGNNSMPLREHKFSNERYQDKAGRNRTRAWRFDFAWIYERVAVEIEGGVFNGGRHSRGMGMVEDCDKYNSAALEGWVVLRYTVKHLENDPYAVVQQVKQALEKRMAR